MRRLHLGQLFNRRYRILNAVGSGPLSRLYRARDEVRGAEVALKLPPVTVTGEQGSAACAGSAGPGEAGCLPAELCHATRLLDEGILGLQLCHENVVRTVDCDIGECSTPYVAVEWLDGEPLVELVAREGPLPTSTSLSLVRDAAAGLAALHGLGYVHCDVKPDNLFVSRVEGGPPRVKVLDLGLARPLGHRPGGDEHVVAGTLQYIAPEQVANEVLDARADIYSLGVVLFRLLTGELPFDTRSPTALLGHHLFSVPPPPSWFVEHQRGAELDRLVLTALRKKPSNRYASMQEFIADIDRFETTQSTLGRELQGEDRFEPVTEHGKQAVGMIARAARILEASATESSVTGEVGTTLVSATPAA